MDPQEYHAELAKRAHLEGIDPVLLEQAFCHPSYARERSWDVSRSNQRLEFLGDAVLSLILAEYLYTTYPELSEGQLTKLKAAAVRSQTLARIARRLDLGDGLLLGRGEAEAGGREKPTLLEDGLEAVIGAAFLSCGFEATRAFVVELFRDIVTENLGSASSFDHKTMLQELMQQETKLTPRYTTVAVFGPAHARVFTVEVSCGSRGIGLGAGPNKQAAQQAAAQVALTRRAEWLPSTQG